MVDKVNNYSHYLRKDTSKYKKREKQLEEIIKIVGEPTQITQVLDMCVAYTLKVLQTNPNELDNMEVYNIKKKVCKTNNTFNNNKNKVIICPTFDEKVMLEYIKNRTFIKNYADIYSYTLSCVANMERDLEEGRYYEQ